MQNLPETVKIVWDYYQHNGRNEMPWRQPQADGSFNPYFILVSELMLQQTQVQRVIPKYHEFLAAFPTIQVLAKAPLAQVLTCWSGLGYNRRAKFLWQAANLVAHEYNGQFPQAYADIVRLPGVGPNTAAAIMAYAYNAPVTFIETNIRSIFIQHCFAHAEAVADAELRPVVDAALGLAVNDDNASHTPRTWHWALMDYGTYVKRTFGNASKKSKSYAKQSRFEGSRRQLRGKVLRMLATEPQTYEMLRQTVNDERLPGVLQDLANEALIAQKQGTYCLGTT